MNFAPAELDRRFTALAIDRVTVWGLSAGIGVAIWRLAAPDDVWMALAGFVGANVLLGLVSGVLVGTTGLTPGKAAVGLRVLRRSDGGPIGVVPGVMRSFVLGLAGWPTLGLGLATLGWTAAMDPQRQRRALHDRIGDALVVDVRPVVAPEVVEEQPQQIVNLTAMRLRPVVPVVLETPTVAPIPVPAAVSPQSTTVSADATGVSGVGVGVPSTPGAVLASPPPASQSGPVGPLAAEAGGESIAGVDDVPTNEKTRLRGAPPRRSSPPSPPPSAPVAATPPPAPRVAPPPRAPQWRVQFDTGEEFLVEGLALVGRRPEARAGEPVRHLVPLSSGDMSLSKTHAQFQVAPDGALVVMDRGSTNGSQVVRKGHAKTLTPGRPSTLLAGDVVRFGDRTMKVSRQG